MVSGSKDSEHGEKDVSSPAKYRMARDVMEAVNAPMPAVGSEDVNVDREDVAMLDAVDCALYIISSSCRLSDVVILAFDVEAFI